MKELAKLITEYFTDDIAVRFEEKKFCVYFFLHRIRKSTASNKEFLGSDCAKILIFEKAGSLLQV
ncbi:MAG: hypothetical protein ACI936_003038 [Paraglaciecola sp.]